jgi:hypothetical protein
MAKRSTGANDTTGGGAGPQPAKRRRAQTRPRAADEGAPAPAPPIVRDSAPELSRGHTEAYDEHADDVPAAPTESVSMASEPSEQDIRMRAYQRFLERGARHGADFDDWLTAERELRSRG